MVNSTDRRSRSTSQRLTPHRVAPSHAASPTFRGQLLAARERFQDNGWPALETREKVAALVVVALIVTLISAPVALLVTGDDTTTQTSPTSYTYEGGSVIAAAKLQDRLFSLDAGIREIALTEDVDPDQASAMRTALDANLGAIRAQYGLPPEPATVTATLAFQPRGYDIRATTGAAVVLSLWNDITLDPGDGSAPTTWQSTADYTMTLTPDGWRLQAFSGTRNGPAPGADDADRFIPLPGYEN